MSFVTKGGTEVPELKLKAHHAVDRTNILYGPSNTGKTVITHHLLKLIKDHVDEGLVVSPTNPMNKAYTGVFPEALIHYQMSIPMDPNRKNDPNHVGKDTPKKGILRFLHAIYQRQEMKAAIYKKASRIAVLSKLYNRLPHAARSKNDPFVKSLGRKQRRAQAEITRRNRGNVGLIDNKIQEAKDRFEDTLVVLYKKFLTPFVGELWAKKDLTESERYSLTYLLFNPRFVAVFDDCAPEIKAVANDPIFKPFFYRGRHVFLTIIIACQDDTDLPANIRKNGFVSMFTAPNVLTAFFGRGSNSFPKETRDLIMKDIAPECFGEGDIRYRRFAFIRDDPTGVHYYSFTANYPKPFRFCAEPLTRLCDSLEADESQLDTENPYFERFRLQ